MGDNSKRGEDVKKGMRKGDVKNGFLYLKAKYIVLLTKKIVSNLCFLSKLQLFKLLVILFTIKLYARNDIFKEEN